jgi:hypothetical protein
VQHNYKTLATNQCKWLLKVKYQGKLSGEAGNYPSWPEGAVRSSKLPDHSPIAIACLDKVNHFIISSLTLIN